MTFTDWLTETKQRYRTQPPAKATKNSARQLLHGFNRRTVDRAIGVPWWERDDWDVLVVLDGLRVDAARETIDADIESVWSPASTSIDWIERHFDERHREHWASAGYVTGNPFAHHDTNHARSADLKDKGLGYLDLVYERAFGEVSGIKTTPPEAITDAAIAAWRREDVDRLIVHYMQPHQPFRSRPDWESVYSNLENLAGEVNEGGPDIWKRCRDGEFSERELWDAYCDNLEWVWEDVQNRLLRNLDADVTVTADHGNGMGEFGVWSHPPGAVAPAVRKVPAWHATGVDERTVQPEGSGEATDGDVTDQLEALGYL